MEAIVVPAEPHLHLDEAQGREREARPREPKRASERQVSPERHAMRRLHAVGPPGLWLGPRGRRPENAHRDEGQSADELAFSQRIIPLACSGAAPVARVNHASRPRPRRSMTSRTALVTTSGRSSGGDAWQRHALRAGSPESPRASPDVLLAGIRQALCKLAALATRCDGMDIDVATATAARNAASAAVSEAHRARSPSAAVRRAARFAPRSGGP